MSTQDIATPSPEAERERVSACWGDAEHNARLAQIHWMGSPVVCAYLNQLASGDPRVDWLTWGLSRTDLPQRRSLRNLRVLVLGCGEGWLERSIAPRAEIASIDACDISAAAVAAAEAAAREAGIEKIRYHVVDLNREPPPRPSSGEGYDLIVAHSVLHHVENLELCYREMAAVLAPNGWLLINEYAGPRRFQFGDEPMRVLNRLLSRLPERLRRSSLPGEIYAKKVVPDEAELVALDPSEAVRSDELARFTRESFSVVAEVDYGGTLLQHLLYDLVQNFDPRSRSEARLLALLCFVEESLIVERRIDADYLVMVARARGAGGVGPRPRARGERHAKALRSDALPVLSAPDREGLAGAAARPAGAPWSRPPRRLVHARPGRVERHGLERPALRAAINARATGEAACDFLTWALHRERPGRGAEGISPRALVLGGPGDWLVERLRRETGNGLTDQIGPTDQIDPIVKIGPIDRLELQPGGGRLPWHKVAGGNRAEGTSGWPGSSSHTRAFTNGWLGRAAHLRRETVRRLAAALAPGGLLFGDDYLGRPDGRPSPSARRYAGELLELLQSADAAPAGRRELLLTRLAALRDRFLRWWEPHLEGEPAETVASILGPDFRVRWARSTGGALLQRILGAAGDALAADDPVDAAFLQIAADLEELLEEAHVLPGDYLVFVAERAG